MGARARTVAALVVTLGVLGGTASGGGAGAAGPPPAVRIATEPVLAADRGAPVGVAADQTRFFDAPVTGRQALAGAADAGELAALAAVNDTTVAELRATLTDPGIMVDEAGVAFTPVPSRPDPTRVRFERSTRLSDVVATTDGARLAGLAAQNQLTVAELRDLAHEPDLHVTADGALLFDDPAPAHAHGPTAAPGGAGGAPLFPLADTFSLHSRPGAAKVVYLDVDGYALPTGTAWRGGAAWTAPALDTAGDGPAFSPAELRLIQGIWQRVAEDYAPFDVDVTTQDPGFTAIDRSDVTDDRFGTRVVVAGTTGTASGLCTACGGVAYVGVYDLIGSNHARHQPAWAFAGSLGQDEKSIAEAVSHEVGHNLGLSHDGVAGGTGYYGGHGHWAPVMGSAYGRPLTQFSRGEYTSPSQTQDDFAVVYNNGLDLRPDDHGDALDTATPLGLRGATTGVIERRDDRDVFEVTGCGGPTRIAVTPSAVGPNLDAAVEVFGPTGERLAADNPPSAYVSRDVATGLDASVTVDLAYGQTVRVAVTPSGAGTGATGYTTYGTRGHYRLGVERDTPCVAHARIDDPTASGPVSQDRWTNPAGGVPVVTRTGPGRHDVTFPGLIAPGGVAQVTSMAPGVGCNTTGWTAGTVSTVCVDPTGAAVDAPLSVLLSFGTGAAHVLTGSATASHVVAAADADNPSGGPTSVTRTGVGAYAVTFAGWRVGAAGNVQVTAFGAGARCVVVDWTDATTRVACTDAAGRPADARFALLRTVGGDGAYALTTAPTAPSSTLTGDRVHGPAGGATVVRTGAGRYRVTFDGLVSGMGNVQVGAHGSDVACAVTAWSNRSAALVCTTAAGAAVDAAVSVLFTRGGALACNGRVVTVDVATGEPATGGADVIQGTPAADVIAAGAGDDLVCGGGGADVIDGGDGDDVLLGGTGVDRVTGGAGDDVVRGRSGDDVVDGGDGDDRLYGAEGADRLTGGDGHDLLIGGGGADVIDAGNGDDTVDGGRTGDVIDGGEGRDRLLGGGGRDTVTGGPGDDVIDGQNGRDHLDGGAGNDVVTGGAGNDVLLGSDGDDLLSGGEGRDRCDGGPGTDTAGAGAGCEVVLGIP